MIEQAIKELTHIFNILNSQKFNSELPEPVVIIQSNRGINKNAMGWCTVNKIWCDVDNTIQKYELTVCAEFLHYPIEETVDTMLHEMVHLYCRVKDIKETSRGTAYHNKKFKEIAESVGMIVDHGNKVGYGYTKLSEEMKEFVKKIEINNNVFQIARCTNGPLKPPVESESNANESESQPRKKSHSKKYICPEDDCKCTVRATKDVNIICADHMEKLIVESGDE